MPVLSSSSFFKRLTMSIILNTKITNSKKTVYSKNLQNMAQKIGSLAFILVIPHLLTTLICWGERSVVTSGSVW